MSKKISKLFSALLFSTSLSFGMINIANAQEAASVPNNIPSAKDFATASDRNFTISPDGSKVAFLTGDSQNSTLVLLNLSDLSEIPIPLGDKTKPRSVQWFDDDTIIINVSFFYNAEENNKSTNYKFEVYRSIVYSLTKKTTVLIMPNDDLQLNGRINIEYYNKKNKSLIASAYSGNKTTFDNSPVLTLYDVKLFSGHGPTILNGNENTRGFYFDNDGNPRLRIDISVLENKGRLFKNTEKKWDKVTEWNYKDDDSFSFQGFLDKDNILITEDENGRDVAKIFNLNTYSKTPYFSDEKESVNYIISDPYSHKPIGVVFEGFKPKIKWFDKDMEKYQSNLDNAFKGKNVSIIDWNEARNKFLVSVNAGDFIEHTYIYDAKDKQAGDLSLIPDNLAAYKLGKKDLLSFKASDGLEIPVFVTFPANKDAKNLPTVVLPHGGPEAHDYSDYDYISQFLASRGYLVIQPQYRGSSGNGADFALKGYGEWGGKMQSDVSEAFDWAVQKGWANKDKVCIVGASYGGYAALMGVSLTPDKYKCAVSYGGVFDLAKMIETNRDNKGYHSTTVAYWIDNIGFKPNEKEKIRSISPYYLAKNIKAPVLLIHGENDSVVINTQSKDMTRALKDAGKQYKYVDIKNEDHWLSSKEGREKFLSEMENFLAPILQ